MARAAGGTSQRLNPDPAIVRSLSSIANISVFSSLAGVAAPFNHFVLGLNDCANINVILDFSPFLLDINEYLMSMSFLAQRYIKSALRSKG